MDKKTILAFVLITFFMAIFMNMQNSHISRAASSQASSSFDLGEIEVSPVSSQLMSQASMVMDQRIDRPAEFHRIETDLYDVEFSTYGAVITSLKLKNFKEDGQAVEMILGDRYEGSAEQAGAFLLYFSANNASKAFYGPFEFKDEGEGSYSFTAISSTSVDGEEIPFLLVKKFKFLPDEYLFNVSVELTQPDGDYLPLNFNGFSYTLESAPQIGPIFEKLDGRNVYRKNNYLTDAKRKEISIKNGEYINNDRVTWAAVTEKYFAFIGVPDSSAYRQIWSDKTILLSDEQGARELVGRQFAFSRTQIKNSKNIDSFYFYVGPKQENILNKYDDANSNGFRLSHLKLGKAMDEAKILYPVEWMLKLLLQLSYSLVRNWGWAILLVTLLVKLALAPLTIKSMLSTGKMAELAPRLKNLQAQYKDNPAAMQQAQMKLYRDEGVNPLAGCLPILLQMPILLAMYGLFNKYFEFRGAGFIGWISDLSAPDSVYTLSTTIPILNISAIRLLPVIYLVSQLLMNKITQTDQTAQNSQMKLMMNLFPVMFFFILYDMPSGLLVYWIASNIFSMLQQVVINYLKKNGKFKQKKPLKKSVKKVSK